MSRPLWAVTGVLAIGTVVTGCAAAQPSTESAASTAAASASAAGPSVTQQATPEVEPDVAADPDGVTPPPVEQLTEQDAAAAVERAVAGMRAYAADTPDPHAWLSGLLPYLSEQAGADYDGTDPSLVPVHRVDGGRLLSGTALACNVAVATDAGEYNVSLTRRNSSAPFLVTRFLPPEEQR